MSGKVPLVPLDEGDLEARLCRALDTSKRAVEFFAKDGYADSERPENSFRPEKPIAETAMLLYAASGAKRFPQVAARMDEVARMLLPFARSEQTLLNIALHPALGIDSAIPHILLSKLGYPDPAIDDFIRSCRNSMARDGRERPPFGSLEKRWIESLWSGTSPGRHWRGDLMNSVLNRPLDVLGGLREDAYAFTHLLMYCTDFGFLSPYLPRARSLILATATALLAKCLDEKDYDLAGEVIMAWPLTGASWSAPARFGFHVLARVEDEIGMLPGGTTKADRLENLKGEKRARYLIATAYHTAYVMGMVCAVSLRDGRAPSKAISGTGFNKSFTDHLVSLVDRAQGHWHAALMELSQSERRTLGPLLLDIALVQKCRQRDFQALSELLVMASRYGVARSLLCAQAAELLDRLAACAGYISARSLSCQDS